MTNCGVSWEAVWKSGLEPGTLESNCLGSDPGFLLLLRANDLTSLFWSHVHSTGWRDIYCFHWRELLSHMAKDMTIVKAKGLGTFKSLPTSKKQLGSFMEKKIWFAYILWETLWLLLWAQTTEGQNISVRRLLNILANSWYCQILNLLPTSVRCKMLFMHLLVRFLK